MVLPPGLVNLKLQDLTSGITQLNSVQVFEIFKKMSVRVKDSAIVKVHYREC